MSILTRALIAFDERRENPLGNLGTLGPAGDAVAVGTRQVTNVGDTAILYFPGVADNGLSVADAAGFTPTTSLSVRTAVALADWTPGVANELVGHWNAGGNQLSWLTRVDTTGRLQMRLSTNGSTASIHDSSVSPTVTDGSWLALRYDWTASPAEVRFSTKATSIATADADVVSDVGWVPLGSPVTVGVPSTALHNSTGLLWMGRHGVTSGATGNFRACHVVVDGVAQLTVDTSVLTDEGATSFEAVTGQTIAIGRSSGNTYKTTILLPYSAKRLFDGTSVSSLAVAHHPALNIGAGDSRTAWALVRTWSQAANGRFIQKWDGTTGAGWTLFSLGLTGRPAGFLDDGPDTAQATADVVASGSLSLIAFTLDRAAGTITSYLNGVPGTPVSTSAIGDLSNTEILHYGRNAQNNSNTAHEEYAWGLSPGALTSAELTRLRTALVRTAPPPGRRSLEFAAPRRSLTMSVPSRTLEITS